MVISPETSTDWYFKTRFIASLQVYWLQGIIAAYELLAHTGNVAIANRMIQLSSFRRAHLQYSALQFLRDAIAPLVSIV
ncbi:hypothetical protein [Nostoc sp.]|uniref:hypothetical protein n=1 Tax=Nostoc sp. TaxID=1180 RepID=UPI002FF85655